MADDDGAHGAAAKVLVGQRQRGLRAFHAHERVEHDPARFAFDKRKVRHVVAAHLLDAVHHLEQAIYVVVARVFPQAGVRAIGGVGIFDERVGLLRPDDTAVGVLDFQRIGRGDKVARGVFVLAFIGEVELVVSRLVRLRRGVGGAFLVGGEARRACRARRARRASGQGHAGEHARTGKRHPSQKLATAKMQLVAGFAHGLHLSLGRAPTRTFGRLKNRWHLWRTRERGAKPRAASRDSLYHRVTLHLYPDKKPGSLAREQVICQVFCARPTCLLPGRSRRRVRRVADSPTTIPFPPATHMARISAFCSFKLVMWRRWQENANAVSLDAFGRYSIRVFLPSALDFAATATQFPDSCHSRFCAMWRNGVLSRHILLESVSFRRCNAMGY